MNRHQRRALAIRDPNGDKLYPRLLYVEERGPDGRPTRCRIGYDDETIAQVLGGNLEAAQSESPRAEFLLVWMGQEQGKPS